jgi:hypothetical protein
MSRPRKKPSIQEQIKIIVSAAIEEGRYSLAKKLMDVLQEIEAPAPEKEKEE